MKFEICCQNFRKGINLVVRARSRKRAIRKIVLEKPELKDFNFYFKYPATK